MTRKKSEEIDIKAEAIEMVYKIYRPSLCKLPRKYIWEYSKSMAIEMTEHFIKKMPEGSSNWLYHRKLIDAIKNL